MFKLESYITPLLLSYVDKYIKNLKPEDSQVSLWGGDAVFNNLDLRLDVLEQELRMPFNFVNGHIHELRIHVPWTKLGSEPVVITINTIECVLKLCENGDGGTSSSTDGSSVKSSTGVKLRGVPPKVVNASSPSTPTTPPPMLPSGSGWINPPTYMQSLINRVANNISVVCNNVILKYVEDDIVLSLNVKSFEVVSANDAWDEAFTDLTLPELVLRKLIRLQDLTVCLDRRNASGKIDAYQDPLLYRCSLECRLYLAFESLHGKHLLSSRLDVLCGRLDFSVTDRQLPMFLRLIELCLALYAREITYQPYSTTAAPSVDGGLAVGPTDSCVGQQASIKGGATLLSLPSDIQDPDAAEQQGWGSWMWSYVPTGLIGSSGDDGDEQPSDQNLTSAVCRFGVHIHQATFVIKATESQGNSTAAFGMPKVTFRPLCCFRTDGVFVDVTFRGIDVFGVQMGFSRVVGSLSGVCACGIHDCIYESNHFFLAGKEDDRDGQGDDYRYLLDSLFDEKSPENCKQQREYVFDWDDHFSRSLDEATGYKASALVFDYFYLMEIPDDLSDESSGLSVSDLEHSNIKESASMRIQIGPIKLDIRSSVVHRALLIAHAASLRDDEPYSRPKTDGVEDVLCPPTTEELSALEKFIPSRSMSVVFVKPVVRLFVGDHPFLKGYSFSLPMAKPRTAIQKDHISSTDHQQLPVFVLHADHIHVSRRYPMYPRRVARAASMMCPPSEHLLHNCHYHFNMKSYGCGLFLVACANSSEGPAEDHVLVTPCDVSVYLKWLLRESLFKNPMIPRKDIICETSHLSLRLTASRIALVKSFYDSWFTREFRLRQLSDDSSLVADVFEEFQDRVEFVVTNLGWRKCDTDIVTIYAGSIGSFKVQLTSVTDGDPVVVPVLVTSAVDTRDDDLTLEYCTQRPGTSSSADRAIGFTLQLLKNTSSALAPSVVVLNVKSVVAHFDPRFSTFVSYKPRVNCPSKAVGRSYAESAAVAAQECSSNPGEADRVSIFSSVATNLSTDPTSRPSRLKSCRTSSQPSESSTGGRFTRMFVDWYPLLNNLIVQIDLDGMKIFVSNNPIRWTEVQPNSFERGDLFDALIICLPSVSVMNGGQKGTGAGGVIVDGIHDVPCKNFDLWNVGNCDKFPWKVEMKNFAVMQSSGGSTARRLEHCLAPGSVSATLAVNSKVDGQHVSQLSVCVHCDIRQVQLGLSNSQARLISSVFRYFVEVFLNAAALLGLNDVTPMSFKGATNSNRLVNRMDSATSGVVETLPDTALVTDISTGIQEECLSGKKLQAPHTKPDLDPVKVSFWIQTTLPKLTVDVFGGDDDGAEVRLKLELEDISSSVDVQDVYSKIKLKIASASSTNYTRRLRDADWILGPFDGITLCCADHQMKIATSIYVTNPKTGMKTMCPHASMESGGNALLEQRGSFVTATFTRAQCRNVQKRWAKVLRDSSGSEFNSRFVSDLCNDSSRHAARFISEIDLKMMPLDCVVWTPLFCTVVDVLALLVRGVVDALTAVTIGVGNEPATEETVGLSMMPFFSTVTLPLTYVNLSTIRVFLPLDEDDRRKRLGRKHSCGRHSKDDFVVLQIDSIYLTPHVDNPLSRVVLLPDIYGMAQRAGILHIPGSEIEDRQYQLDVNGFSLSTSVWDDLMSYTKRSLPSSDASQLQTMGENPALEWNTKPRLDDGESNAVYDVLLCPLVWKFDVRVVAAPAIVYEGKASSDDATDILVAAHSLELNVTTDVDVYVGPHQVLLFKDLFLTDAAIVASNGQVAREHDLAPNLSSEPSIKDVRDSGIESESSIFNPLGLKETTLPPKPVVQTTESSCTPFEALVTARCITVTAYNLGHLMPPPIEASSSQKSPKIPTTATFAAGRTRWGAEWIGGQSTSTEDSPVRVVKPRSRIGRKRTSQNGSSRFSEMEGYEGSEEESQDDDDHSETESPEAASFDVIPLLHVYVCQPHALLKWQSHAQKVEISCYDVAVRGRRTSSETSKNASRHLRLPNPEDYGLVWFDTLPGDMNPKTGVLPALFTLTATDFYRNCGVHLNVDRPWRIGFNNRMYEEIRQMADVIRMHFMPETNPASRTMDEGRSHDVALANRFRSCFSGFSEIGYQTREIVLACDVQGAQLILAVANSSGSASFRCNAAEYDGGNDDATVVDGVTFGLEFGALILQTACPGEEPRTMVGPLSLASSMTTLWNEWNAFSPYPLFLWKLDVDTVFVAIDRPHLRCIKMVVAHLIEDASGESDPTREPTIAGPSPLEAWFTELKKTKVTQRQTWQDDLRVGTFQYTQHSDDCEIGMPASNEIIFCKEHDGLPASMTWRYRQPRCLIRVEIQPVPFRAASEVSMLQVDDAQLDYDYKCEVRCALQAYDDLRRQFVTYRIFNLSEVKHCVLDVPLVEEAVAEADIVVSQTWRVVMDFSDDSYDDSSTVRSPRRGLVSPLALAACMRIDSCFDTSIVPLFESLMTVDLMRITLSNHFPETTKSPLPSMTSRFKLDGTMPEYQEFLIATVENLNFRCRQWRSMLELRSEMTFVCELVDYKFLTLRHLVEPVAAKVKLFAVDDVPKPIVVEMAVDFGPVFIYLSQTAVHTLGNAFAAFGGTTDDCLVVNRYVISNGTRETLRFGQVATDENVSLQSRRSHAYSWRSHRTKQVLHICVEGMRWKWCDPFGIDTIGTQIRVISCKTRKATLVIEVKEVTATQIHVLISGELTVSNRLLRQLELRLCDSTETGPDPSYYESGLADDRIALLEGSSCAPSFIVQPADSRWVIQLRLSGELCEEAWSRDINVNDNLGADGTLMTVKSADQCCSFWIHVFSQPIVVGEGVVAKKLLVVLAPMYVARSHLPHPLTLELSTPASRQTTRYELGGMGGEHQLQCTGDPNQKREVCFRQMPDSEVSSPHLPLTLGVIGRRPKPSPPSEADIEAFYNGSTFDLPYRWPYDDEDLERKSMSSPPPNWDHLPVSKSPKSVTVTDLDETVFQSNIELEVSRGHSWPGCRTLVVDVKPWALLVNRTSLDLVFCLDRNLPIAKDGVLALPVIAKPFKFGLEFEDDVFFSDVIELSTEDVSVNRYWQRVDGVLPVNGHLSCDIRVDTSNVTRICRLALTVVLKEGMRILTAQGHLTVINDSTAELLIGTFTVPNIGKKLRLDYADVTTVPVPVRGHSPTPVLFCDVFDVPEEDRGSVIDGHVQYMLFSLNADKPHWGYPCRIELTKCPDRIYSFAVPQLLDSTDDDSSTVPLPLRVSVHHHMGRIFLFVKEDNYPQLKLYNNCNFALHFGQTTTTTTTTTSNSESADCGIHEEHDLLDILPVLDSYTCTFYTFPIVAESFPEMLDSRQLPRLHFAQAVTVEGSCRASRSYSETSTTTGASWSAGVNVTTLGDQFLSVPNCGDMKVHVEIAEGVVHIFLDPVNRVEVSAKEIRSRITVKESPKSSTTAWRKPRSVSISRQRTIGPLKKKTAESSPKTIDVETIRRRSEHRRTDAAAVAAAAAERTWFYGTVHVKHVCVILLDDTSEILRVSADDIHASSRPTSTPMLDDRLVPLRRQEFIVCISDIQVDNQLHCTGDHDFSVVLVRQDPVTELEESSSRSADVIRRQSLLVIAVVLERIKGSGRGCWYPHVVELTVKPLTAFVEDTLLYKLSRYCRSFVLPDARCRTGPVNSEFGLLVPEEVILRAANLGSPLAVQQFTVNPTSIVLSVHASVKLFISLNRTPLSFGAFERRAIHTTWYRLGHALTMHYLSGALFRAGWVIGSLDLLANPGGFARAVSTGMADFVRMPYNGMTRGPWAFVVGVVHGSSSLLRHIGSGTVLSITSLAESVSRNMDRLSFDSDHLRRNEELRRCGPPSGVASGLAQGLTGFGVGLLGAIAGIVDQPLQSIQEGGEHLEIVSTAAGIVSGVGRGLVGIVTKPIGGAAELVAQTGQGILHGAGWAQVLKCRYDAVVEDPSSRVNSTLKYVWKMLPSGHLQSRGPSTSKVFALEATHFNSGPVQYAAAVLLLTPEVLFVVSTEVDTQQHAFPLGELDCRGHASDPTLVYFVARRPSDPEAAFTQLEDRNRDRIAEFVDRSSKYALLRSPPSSSRGGDELESISDASSHASQVPIGSPLARFYVNPRLRLTFLNLYRAAQRRLLGKGYLK